MWRKRAKTGMTILPSFAKSNFSSSWLMELSFSLNVSHFFQLPNLPHSRLQPLLNRIRQIFHRDPLGVFQSLVPPQPLLASLVDLP
jgi:hypothetical protein